MCDVYLEDNFTPQINSEFTICLRGAAGANRDLNCLNTLSTNPLQKRLDAQTPVLGTNFLSIYSVLPEASFADYCVTKTAQVFWAGG